MSTEKDLLKDINTWPIVNPFHWGFNGTVRHRIGAQGTVKLQLNEGASTQNGLDSKDKVSLDQFVSEYVPGLKNGAKFQLDKKLFTGILQTMYLGGGDFSKKFPVFYGREIVKFSDGGVCTADWVMNGPWRQKYQFDPSQGTFNKDLFNEDERATHPENWPRLQPRTRYLNDEELKEIHSGKNNERPLVVILHGLAGGSHEPIIRSLTDHLSKAGNGKFQVVVLNSRGCARSKITTPGLFTAFHYLDIKEFLEREHEKAPNRKMYAVGCSFGSTILANYLGFIGERTPLRAAATFCNPWDMVLASYKINKDFWSQHIFSQTVAQFLVRMVKVNMKELEVPEGTKPSHTPTPENPSYFTFTQSNLKKAYKMKHLSEFDTIFTAPALGFKNAMDYYQNASSVNRLTKIAIPLLSVNSTDDPIVGTDHIPMHYLDENPNVLVCETDLGGHLAYLQDDGDSWATKQISNFFDKFDEFVM